MYALHTDYKGHLSIIQEVESGWRTVIPEAGSNKAFVVKIIDLLNSEGSERPIRGKELADRLEAMEVGEELAMRVTDRGVIIDGPNKTS